MNEEISKSLSALHKGLVILYPSDTLWALGCDATNSTAVDKIYQIKSRPTNNPFICLVSNVYMLKEYLEEIPEKALELISSAKTPLTIIYQKSKNLAKNVSASDNSIAIRVVKFGFVYQLIERFKKPIISTSANTSGTPFPKHFVEIEDNILHSVDYVVNLPNDALSPIPSAIVKVEANGELQILRP